MINNGIRWVIKKIKKTNAIQCNSIIISNSSENNSSIETSSFDNNSISSTDTSNVVNKPRQPKGITNTNIIKKS